MISKVALKIQQNIAVICILIGASLVSITIYPYQNPDTIWETDATLGVIQWGMPYVITYGNIMNQPPLGFYFQALFSIITGQSIDNGVILVTFFGVFSAFLIYKIGQELYGKTSGLIAAALFVFTPWQIIISRSYLIDAQCLFFSLLTFYFGVKAAKNSSRKLAFVSGLAFAAAFLTKLFAVFTLVPLFLFFVYFQKGRSWLTKVFLITLFLLPLLACSYLWYIQMLGPESARVFMHQDFIDTNPAGIVPSSFFVGTFLLNYGLGVFLVLTMAFSVILSIATAKIDKQNIVYDGFFVFSVLFVLIINTVLGAFLNLRAPYTDAFKYAYQSLPAFCLVTGSLAKKSGVLLNTKTVAGRFKKAAVYLAVFTGVFLLGASLVFEFAVAHQLSVTDFVQFRPILTQEYGYSLDHKMLTNDNPLFLCQYSGYFIVLSALTFHGVVKLKMIFDKSKRAKQKMEITALAF